MNNLKIVNIHGELYQVYRILKDDPKWDFNILKKLWNCTHTFRSDGMLYVCREIIDTPYETIS
jgi:hypothetical protein|tara:strand:- start:1285 stop:1473 length:189 start_codon:yes stop_codon:yes gene_type:complete